MQPQTIFIMGPSGAGKGTQAALLREYLQDHDSERNVLYIQIGKRLRDVAGGDTPTADKLRAYLNDGLLAPEFLTVWAWGDELVRHCEGEQHLVFDGSPRRLGEAHMLDEALRFYKRENWLVFILDVSRDWSLEMLAKRKREDDIQPEDIERRLAWYKTDVVPVIDFFKQHNLCRVVRVDGERPIADVHEDILAEVHGRHGEH